MINAEQLFHEQLTEWDEFRQRVEQLDTIKLRSFDMGDYTIYAQYNPARAISSGAKLDAKSIAARKCFLCQENRPSVQKQQDLNERFILLVNPFPILKGHMTIPHKEHKVQEILPFIDDFISFCKTISTHTLLYNGPQCGASAPDHLHFQAVSKGQLPFESEMQSVSTRVLSECKENKMEEFVNYGRKCIHIQCEQPAMASSYFQQLYKQLQMREGSESEPKMNLFGFYEKGDYHLLVFPRKKHRPSQYFEEGEAYKMISPGAIDIAGILVLPRKEDFDNLTKEEILDVFSQVSY